MSGLVSMPVFEKVESLQLRMRIETYNLTSLLPRKPCLLSTPHVLFMIHVHISHNDYSHLKYSFRRQFSPPKTMTTQRNPRDQYSTWRDKYTTWCFLYCHGNRLQHIAITQFESRDLFSGVYSRRSRKKDG